MEPYFIQVLGAIPILDYFAKFYHQVIHEADKRTASWAFMSSPDVPVSVVLVYLFIVLIFGPFLLRFIKIPVVNSVLIIYNSFVLTLNLWLGISFCWHIFAAGYHFSCQKIQKYGEHENAIAYLLWVFHCSKLIELIDTLFLVLKRKGNQLTFLHLYHHSTIVFATWMCVKFVPGGSSAVIAMVNSGVHFFMYFYYEMMVLRVKSFRSYKKFITILQIVQFLATIMLCITAIKQDCGYSKWILNWLLLYMISFLMLFLHFYVQTYWKPKEIKVKEHDELTANDSEDTTGSQSMETRKIRNDTSTFSADEDEHPVEDDHKNTIDQTIQRKNYSIPNDDDDDPKEIRGSNGDFDFEEWENLNDSLASSDESVGSDASDN